MTYEEFTDKYKPIINPIARKLTDNSISDSDITSFNGRLFETYGNEVQFVLLTIPAGEYVWTILETDNGLVLTNGFHHINAFGYFVCKEEYTSTTMVEINLED